jgi:intein/homing endonuclease
LDGDTLILTDKGEKKIKDLVNQKIKVVSYNEDTKQCELSDYCNVRETKKDIIEYEIELEDGTVIKCTPEHRFLLADGTYKEAQNLSESDDILEFIPYGYIYKTTNLLNGKIYIGQHKKNILKEEKQYYDVVNACPHHNFLIKTNTGYVCSHNCFFDEISFIRNQNIDIQKQKAIDMIDTAIGGMMTRFVHNGKNPTLLMLASSKRSEKSFLEEHIRTKLASEPENVMIVDEPV